MHTSLRGECIYTAESDVHFPELTVEETLHIAAEARKPQYLRTGESRTEFISRLTQEMIKEFQLSSCVDTKIGNSTIRGLSGGEQKRVTLAEAFMGGAAVQCWDQSTRGMDSETALRFIHNLHSHVHKTRSAAAVTIYQCSQAIYESFDNVTVLHSGRQIYYGTVRDAEAYFTDMGFQRASNNMSVADFLTALTSPVEASTLVSAGCEDMVPRGVDDFVKRWRSSPRRERLLSMLQSYEQKHPLHGSAGQQHMAYLRTLRKRDAAAGRFVKIILPEYLNL